MPSSINDHAFLSNTRGSALVDRSGCIDWLCLPRFDSPACFAALLGTTEHGCWELAPAGQPTRTRQRYRDDTLVVETEIEVAEGTVCIADCMPIDPDCAEVVRVVRGVSGRVPMKMRFRPRFQFGSCTPELVDRDGVVIGHAGDEALAFNASVPCRVEEGDVRADFELAAGDRVTFAMTFARGGRPTDPPMDPDSALESCAEWWREWAGRCEYDGPWRDAVMRSLLTLKGLIYEPTGGIIAAATTSLPEVAGGCRNWDYRFCWLRDATFTLYALLGNGYRDEACKWRDWLVDAVRREPLAMHVLYQVDCDSEMSEATADWLPGYRDSRPVRIGNEAGRQFQLDIRGEVLDVLHVGRENGLEGREHFWDLQVAILEDLEQRWRDPDRGIWEMRGGEAHFVHSKALAWVGFDRCIRAAREGLIKGPVEHWCEVRDAIRADIYEHGFDRERGIFVQRYGAKDLDASLLLLPLVGFVAADSPEAMATADAIGKELAVDGLLRRYSPDNPLDGLPGVEGAFLPCSFWMVDNLALSGRVKEARHLFERLLGLCNHVGLLSEEYDIETGDMLGNIPQGLTHVGLINSARIVADAERGRTGQPDPTRPEQQSKEQGGRGHSPTGARAAAPDTPLTEETP